MAQYSGTLDDGRISFGVKPAPKVTPAPTEVKDVVCGKMVHTSDAVTISISGNDFYFCSAECAIRFEAAPNKFGE
jgi:YHS domain-containing protein